jgi:hypothetical protein
MGSSQDYLGELFGVEDSSRASGRVASGVIVGVIDGPDSSVSIDDVSSIDRSVEGILDGSRILFQGVLDGATDSLDVEPLGAADGIFVGSYAPGVHTSSGWSTPGVLDGSKDSSSVVSACGESSGSIDGSVPVLSSGIMLSRATDSCTSSLEAIVVSLESLDELSDEFLQTTRIGRKDSGRPIIEPLERFAFESSAGQFDGVPLVEVFDAVEAKLDAVFASLWGAPFGETHDERIFSSTASSDVPPAPLHGEHFGLE